MIQGVTCVTESHTIGPSWWLESNLPIASYCLVISDLFCRHHNVFSKCWKSIQTSIFSTSSLWWFKGIAIIVTMAAFRGNSQAWSAPHWHPVTNSRGTSHFPQPYKGPWLLPAAAANHHATVLARRTTTWHTKSLHSGSLSMGKSHCQSSQANAQTT